MKEKSGNILAKSYMLDNPLTIESSLFKKILYIIFVFMRSNKYYCFLKKNIGVFISHWLCVLELQFL